MIELKFTERATLKVKDFILSQNKEGLIIRITVPNSGPQGYNYQFFIDEEKNVQSDDVVVPFDTFKAVVDVPSSKKLDGAEVDWVEGVQGSGFKVDNPNRPHVNLEIPIEQRINELFDSEINPILSSHDGEVQLIEVIGPRVYVKLSGGCQGCASSTATLKQGIEVRIKEVAPEILEVIDTTDHAKGTNPYFQN